MSGAGTGIKATKPEGSFTYDPQTLSLELNRLRLELGDTDENEPLLQDEEVAKVQAEKGSFYLRAAECCRLICAKVSRKTKVKISGFSEDANSVYDRYRSMQDRFVQLASASYPWAASIQVSEKSRNELDTGLVQPKFKKGQFDYE